MGLALAYTFKKFLYLSTFMLRYKEKDSGVEKTVLEFIATCEKPSTVVRDSALAAYYYGKYVSHASNSRGISKPYYLYIWLCSREHRSVSVRMSDYKYFSDDTINMGTISYRDFTQMYADPIVDPGTYNIRHSCKLISTIYHNYPISLKSVLDNYPVGLLSTTSSITSAGSKHTCTLVENQLVITKCAPTLMEHPLAHSSLEVLPDDCTLLISSSNSQIRCDRRYTTIDSTDEKTHSDLVSLMTKLTDSTLPVETNMIQHVFAFPSREINYTQVLRWMIINRIPYSHLSSTQVTTGHLITGTKCTVAARTLDRHTCYDNGRYEVYRLKGDLVLEVTTEGVVDVEVCGKAMLSMCVNITSSSTLSSIPYTYQDPLTCDAPNIARLRATNSIVYDGMYCRKAPPQVQPLVIAEDEIQDVLQSGRMILVYEGSYYTTMSDRHCYIGMINRFGDYDPSKPYVPIIRTYTKNHLLSKKFKEFKAYLLRHSPNPNEGIISSADLLLPQQMAYLYRRPLINPELNVASIHTKKTSVVNSVKVSSGEVPDYVKSMLGTPDVRRVVVAPKGTGLLEACGVSANSLLEYIISHQSTLLDLVSLTIDDMTKHVQEGMLDHRLYGRAIEELTGSCVIVFAVAGIVPYRCTSYEASNCTLLFLSDIGVYDTLIILGDSNSLQSNVKALRDISNSKHVDIEPYMKIQPSRRIDHIQVMIGLVSYISRYALKDSMNVVYVVVDEQTCTKLVDQVYKRPIYYEGITKSRNARFAEKLVTTRINNANVEPNIRWICYMLRPLIHLETVHSVHILSPIDMSEYHLWQHSIEDCLYPSVEAYELSDKEEVQYRYKSGTC